MYHFSHINAILKVNWKKKIKENEKYEPGVTLFKCVYLHHDFLKVAYNDFFFEKLMIKTVYTDFYRMK